MTLQHTLHTQWTPLHDDTSWELLIPETWMQGRSVFGGLVGATAAALHTRALGDERAIRTITAQFLRPTKSGPIQGECVKLREGKHVTFARSTLSQDGAPTYIADIVSTHPRETSLAVTNAHILPKCPGPDDLDDLPYIPGLTPEFTQHFQMRWAKGGYPYSGAKQASTVAHLRYREVEASGLEGVLGLLDALPAPSLSLLTDFAAASSVSWTAHILHTPEHFDQWFTFAYDTLFGEQGFHTVVGYLYDSKGNLIAWTNQLAAIYG